MKSSVKYSIHSNKKVYLLSHLDDQVVFVISRLCPTEMHWYC